MKVGRNREIRRAQFSKAGEERRKRGRLQSQRAARKKRSEIQRHAIARENYDGTLIIISPMKTIIHRGKRGRRKCRPSLAFASDKTGKTKQWGRHPRPLPRPPPRAFTSACLAIRPIAGASKTQRRHLLPPLASGVVATSSAVPPWRHVSNFVCPALG